MEGHWRFMKYMPAMLNYHMEDIVPSVWTATADCVSHSGLYCLVNESASKWLGSRMDITTKALVWAMATQLSTHHQTTQCFIMVARTLLPQSMDTGWSLLARQLLSVAVFLYSVCVLVVRSIMDVMMKNMAYCLLAFALIYHYGLSLTCVAVLHHWNSLACFFALFYQSLLICINLCWLSLMHTAASQLPD